MNIRDLVEFKWNISNRIPLPVAEEFKRDVCIKKWNECRQKYDANQLYQLPALKWIKGCKYRDQ